jgi:hypothetical protein
MPQASATFETYDAKGNREDLANVITMITPKETPLLSLLKKRPVKAVKHEWQTDALAAPDLNNNQPEGSEWDFDPVNPTTRVGNYCQISNKKLIISGTQEEVVKAGRTSELSREITKKGAELKIDQEIALLSNQASSAGAGDGASNRTLGGLRAWTATNDNLGAGGASGGFNQTTGVVDAATNGTQRAFTKALMDSTISAISSAGGNPDIIMGSNYVKTVFSTFMSDANVAQQRYAASKSGQTKIIGAADVYESDFGEFSFVANKQMTRAGATIARNVFFLEAAKLALGVLRDYDNINVAKTGDNEKRVIQTEYTLINDNEAAHGCIADVFGLTAST